MKDGENIEGWGKQRHLKTKINLDLDLEGVYL